jgi:2,3-bisphosphoglycerate-independent phosphoglycerate mutase
MDILRKNEFDVIILNYTNPDMVGHTGVFEATVQAVEAVDKCLGQIAGVIKELGGTLLLTSDHGNAESKLDLTTGLPLTAHTTNPVPFILVDERFKNHTLREGGALCDIAPTILELLNIPKPLEMTGTTLIKL